MARTHQQEVTRQQVLHKRQEALREIDAAVAAAPSARTGEEYEEIVRRGVKAAQDYEAWGKVIPSL